MANKTIAVVGKGGVGKTTTCGMIIDYLTKKNDGPVLVVDADANSNLNEVLGVDVDVTLGSIREEIAHSGLTARFLSVCQRPIMQNLSLLMLL